VVGRNGEDLGKISRLVLAPGGRRIEDLVIKATGFWRHERIVPLSLVRQADRSRMELDLTDDELRDLEEFDPEAFRAPMRNDMAPPSTGGIGIPNSDFGFDEAIFRGGIEGKPAGYPGDEVQVSEDQQLAVIRDGLDVFDAEGEMVAALKELCLDVDTGRPTRVVVRRGFLFTEESEVPVGWIRTIAPSGITLNVPGDMFDAQMRAA
jgi:sporulation protein YlmC with PRC-barrel domain